MVTSFKDVGDGQIEKWWRSTSKRSPPYSSWRRSRKNPKIGLSVWLRRFCHFWKRLGNLRRQKFLVMCGISYFPRVETMCQEWLGKVGNGCGSVVQSFWCWAFSTWWMYWLAPAPFTLNHLCYLQKQRVDKMVWAWLDALYLGWLDTFVCSSRPTQPSPTRGNGCGSVVQSFWCWAFSTWWMYWLAPAPFTLNHLCYLQKQRVDKMVWAWLDILYIYIYYMQIRPIHYSIISFLSGKLVYTKQNMFIIDTPPNSQCQTRVFRDDCLRMCRTGAKNPSLAMHFLPQDRIAKRMVEEAEKRLGKVWYTIGNMHDIEWDTFLHKSLSF